VLFAAAVYVAGGWLWRGLRTAVLDPVERLAGQARAVAAGDTHLMIVPHGPPEIARLGRDVDRMRGRIAAELVRAEQAIREAEARGDELARSNADLEQFAYVASHDLSEPLRKVANFCQLLERQYAAQLDDKARQYIYFAVDGAKRMQILIGDLLAFSRVGRTTERFVEADLRDLFDRAVANLEERIATTDPDLVVGPLPVVQGDPSLLTALLQNLLGNALKYRSDDRPRVEVDARRDGDHWLISMADNGIGIDPQYAERIFVIFQRLHLRDQYGGTGIGLALCRKIVEFHGGRIWLEAGRNHLGGATFRFSLPVEREQAYPHRA
jgi:light-regulated signal transduction histidine kinase (bacteriophytochrome)